MRKWIMESLGFKRVGGRWVTQEDLDHAGRCIERKQARLAELTKEYKNQWDNPSAHAHMDVGLEELKHGFADKGYVSSARRLEVRLELLVVFGVLALLTTPGLVAFGRALHAHHPPPPSVAGDAGAHQNRIEGDD